MKTLAVSSLLICSALSLSPVFAVVYTSDYELTGTETQSFSIKANAGEVVTVSAHGGISVEMAGDTFIGDMSNAGTANFVIDGSGNHISFVNAFCLENKGQAGSAVNLLISGSNNTLSAGAFIDYCGVDTTSTVSVTGSNNTLIWTGIHRGYGDIRGGENPASAGSVSFYFKGDGAAADERVYFYVDGGNGFRAAGSTLENSTFKTKTELAGYVTFGKSDGSRGNISLGYESINGDDRFGQHEFVVSGSNNILTAAALNVGRNTMTAGSWGRFTVSSVDSEISVNYLNNLGGVEAGRDNIAGGIVSFEISSDSISTINATNVSNFSGLLELDFSGFTDAEVGRDYTYTLIASSSDWSGKWSEFGYANGDSDKLIIKFGEGQEAEVTLNYQDNSLYATVNFSSVPEASTCAAIFGALALVFALCNRRRKF